MTVVIPRAPGVPGFANQGPNWWDAAQVAPPPQWNQLTDPRWNGAVRHTFNMGTLDVAALRAVRDDSSIFLSFQVSADPQLDNNQDGIYVGLQGPSGTAYVIHIEAFTSAMSATDAQIPDPTVQTFSGGTWSDLSRPPTWIKSFARAWVTPISGASTKNQWAVNLRIPLLTDIKPDLTNSGIYLGPSADALNFKLWYAIEIDTPSGVVEFYWPRSGAAFGGTFGTVPPDPSKWDTVASSGPNVGGLWFQPQDIGCRFDPADPSAIGASTAQDTLNPLFVNVHNSTGATAPASTIDASFRIANWGTTGDFTAESAATAWLEIHPETTKSNLAAILDGGAGEIQYKWNLTTVEAKPWLTPPVTRMRHQCMLVTLSADAVNPPPAPGYVFLNDSCYTNMNIVDASVVEQQVEFNVVGLENFAAGQHVNVYVFVERNNMPQDVPRGGVAHGRGSNALLARAFSARGGDLSWEEAATIVPTVVYHVFVGTKVKFRRNGQDREVLQPMTSFGSFVRHEGLVYGWDTNLSLEGLTEIAPNWFKVRVPKGGKLIGTTHIKAWETKRPRGGCLMQVVEALEKLAAAIRKLL